MRDDGIGDVRTGVREAAKMPAMNGFLAFNHCLSGLFRNASSCFQMRSGVFEGWRVSYFFGVEGGDRWMAGCAIARRLEDGSLWVEHWAVRWSGSHCDDVQRNSYCRN